MANIQPRYSKGGKLISYSIRVHRGRGADGKQLKPYTTTFEVLPTWTEKSARKKAEAFAATFEKECKEGTTSDSRLKFAEYCDYVIDLKQMRGAKHSTIVRYKDLAARIAPAIGHIKLKDLRADHLNSLYTALAQPGQNKRTGGGLSAKTILEHHRLISTVLDHAEKEGLVPFNVAHKAMLPKQERREVNYFQPEQVEAIRDALELEPIKWRTITHLFLITGARRGEILGLKWDKVDFEQNRIHICNNVLYSPDRGIYESTPKTDTSNRYVTLPLETMKLLRKYRAWQNEERLRLGEYYQYQGFVFTQDNGQPMHPDGVTTWLDRFSKRHSLPHISPHAFRHPNVKSKTKIFYPLFLNNHSKIREHRRVPSPRYSLLQKFFDKSDLSVCCLRIIAHTDGRFKLWTLTYASNERRYPFRISPLACWGSPKPRTGRSASSRTRLTARLHASHDQQGENDVTASGGIAAKRRKGRAPWTEWSDASCLGR